MVVAPPYESKVLQKITWESFLKLRIFAILLATSKTYIRLNMVISEFFVVQIW
jgi:hypothetical protein